MLTEQSHEIARNARTAADGVAGYPDDVLIVASRTRTGLVHRVTLNVLVNQPAACTCEAWRLRREWCHAMKTIAEEECSYVLQRCAKCGALCRLGEFFTRSGERIVQLICSSDAGHSGHVPAAARLMRTEVTR